MSTNGHPLEDKDLYTPVTPEMLAMFNRQRVRYGTWRALAAAIGCRTRVLRFIRSGRNKCVSLTFLEKVLIATGQEYTLNDYLWFTAEDLVKLGIWDPAFQLTGPLPRRRARRDARRR